jgi:hypothetical protein
MAVPVAAVVSIMTAAVTAAAMASAMMAATILVTSSRNGFAMESGASLWVSDRCFN